MINEQLTEKFRQIVENKYQIYNALFMSLPYDRMTNIGMLLPFLYEESRVGYAAGKTPVEILDEFFENHTTLSTPEQKNELLFKIIQYVERQVVLFDSIEDAAFSQLHSEQDQGTVMQLFDRALQQNKLPEVRKKMEDFGIRVVFTAHPTQFYPNDVQRILHDLRTAISKDNVTEIDLLLQQLGKTPFVNRERPTPLDEALSIIYYLRNVYYDTIGELYQKIKLNFGTKDFVPHHDIVQLGFWPGGDRDGNPFVTSEITQKVAEDLRISILKCYYEHLKTLRRRLTFRGVSEVLEDLSHRIYDAIFHFKIISDTEIIDMVDLAQEQLNTLHNGLFGNLLGEFRDRVKIFGTHFAALDIRQDSRVHQQVIDEIFTKYSGKAAEEQPHEDKIEFLLNGNVHANADDFEGITRETLQSIINVRKIQHNNGVRGMHRYIISNSDHTKDVMNVFALFRICGYAEEDIKMDIVPLFETMEGLANSEAVMHQLYNDPVYRKHVQQRGGQTIMLGFSDGTKDGGYLKANFEIYETKERLTRISEAHGIKVIYFDGRGGPPARGGGKTHDFYASQGSKIANHKIEITIQGQTITSVFGNKDQAKYNFEQLLTAGIESAVFKDVKKDLTADERALLEELAAISFQKYTDLKEHPMFVPYLEEMSTLRYYGRTNIGSRPTKRGGGGALKFEDLRAIPFVGSWALLKQNVPGFFGFGYALYELKQQRGIEVLVKLYRESDFFKTLVLNSMMSMNKTYFELTSYMKNDKKYGEFWNILHEEFELSKAMMLEITGFKVLQQDELLSRKSVRLREKIVLPLLTIQQYALIKIQEGEGDIAAYEKMVTRSLFGNINASRNSA